MLTTALDKEKNTKIIFLEKTIKEVVFIKKENPYGEKITSRSGLSSRWIFDFRKIFLDPITLDTICELFWDKYEKEYPFQVGGIEVSAIPIVAGLTVKSIQKGKPVNGFFIRKSRKKDGLTKMVEGKITNEKIILVDDILNTGKSFMRQVEVIESLGKKVDKIFTIIRFRDLDYYQYFHERGITIESVFCLDDFKDSLGTHNFIERQTSPIPMPFKVDWVFKSPDPNYFYVVPKSDPVIDEKNIYFGSDNGTMWAINQEDGCVSWKFKTLFGSQGKSIFSSPALYNNLLYFGAYDGNFYALNKETGKKEWIFMEADWIGSSPCVAEDLSSIFVGLEFGLWKKRGGIVSLDANTGKKKWEYIMPDFTHSSPVYSNKKKIVICGCNDNFVYAFNAKDGELLWKIETGGDIKESFALSDDHELVAFGSFDNNLYIAKTNTGEVVHKIVTLENIYSTPTIQGDHVYFSSLDKNIYCASIITGKIKWTFSTIGRVFSSPAIIENKVYVGSNDGRLYELDPETGKNTAILQVTERITNKIAYNSKTKKFFLPTFANEIYCLNKKSATEIVADVEKKL